jgi:hypothetical protein
MRALLGLGRSTMYRWLRWLREEGYIVQTAGPAQHRPPVYRCEHRPDGPYTPIFDDVVRDVGFTGAVVFGTIWRHEQMRDGCSHAALDTMAAQTGLRRRTVRKWLGILTDTGMIDRIADQTGHRPPTYVTTYVPEVLRRADVDLRSKSEAVAKQPHAVEAIVQS